MIKTLFTDGSKKTTRKASVLMTALLVLVILLIIFYVGLKQVALWFDYNKIVFVPLEVNVQIPKFLVEERPTIKPIGVTYVKEDLASKEEMDIWQVVESSPNPKIASLIVATFPEDAREMIAILTHESGLNEKAMGWNCLYVRDGETVSEACKVEDRHKAWSVDCGFGQINISGTTCPEEAFNPIWNIEKIRYKYDTQGKNAWVSYWTGRYKEYL
jgi:hypothetical protein